MTDFFILYYGLKKEDHKNTSTNLIWKEYVLDLLQKYEKIIIFTISIQVFITYNGKYVELKVPGLGEKRPSLIPGDYVYINYNNNIVHGGCIQRVLDEYIWIADFRKESVIICYDMFIFKIPILKYIFFLVFSITFLIIQL